MTVTPLKKQTEGANTVIEHSSAIEVPSYFARKAVYSRLFAMFLLVGFLPIMLLFMLLTRLTSAGPALFRQKRLGKDGILFDVLKIRTMYSDAEHLSGPVLCTPGDSRITPLGKLMRFLHIDELPQLINVVRGEMCLVGPRPERPEIIRKNRLDEIVPGFADRTQVRPGVTGLAQINLAADVTAECVIPKVALDLEYIRTANASLDFRILLCTALRMLGVRHGRAVRALGLARTISGGVDTRSRVERGKLRPSEPHFNGQHAHGRKASLALAASTADGSGAFSLTEFEANDQNQWDDGSVEEPSESVPRRPR